MNTAPLIIGLSGKARCGKTSIAEHLVQVYSFTSLSFAEPLYQAVKAMFRFTDEDFRDDKKEVVNEYWGFSPRKALQLIGTEAGRKLFREDIWIKNAELRMKEYISWGKTRFVVSDVRYENEADFIRTYSPNSYVWHVRRKNGTRITESGHLSEQGILFHPEKDELIDNDGTLTSLAMAVNDLAQNTFLKS